VLRVTSGAEVVVVAGDFPGEEDVFDSGSGADVVLDEVAAGVRGFFAHDDSDVRNVAAEVPGDEFAGQIVGAVESNRQRFAFARKKDLKIRNAAMVDVGVRVSEHPAPLVRIEREIRLHVFVNFFLQIDAKRAVGADDFVGADASAGGNIAVGIGDSDVSGVVADDELCATDCRRGESFEEGLVGVGTALLGQSEARRVEVRGEHQPKGNAEGRAAHR